MAKSNQKILSSVAKFTPRQFKSVTEQMYRRNLELAQLNKTLSLLRTIDLIVLNPNENLRSLCNKISAAIVHEYKECALAALYSDMGDDSSDILLLGASSGKMNAETSSPAAVGQFLQSLTPPHALDDLKHNFFTVKKDAKKIAQLLGTDVAALREITDALYIQGFYFAPLKASSGVAGVLVIGLHESESAEDQSLLARVGEAVSLAMENKALQEENRRILQKLQASNARLKELDETKDDFISMASHQLRTPLTSIKGYLSMVLEGDAGKINETQKKMLGQAFVSSQRMVYLIADLLNVSRLRTGKFIIEPTATNLAHMVDEELSQLVETAAARDLELTYDKPKDFPDLQLDETKTRQVIMNFVDNAIYYTPAGGHIRVELEDTPLSVELRVIDDGIGVPKQEQHHLFTKFYRAGNARKARPDGTGLGLFMAKKVVLAQGGSIIFESKEGSGSTFGFTFPKPTSGRAKLIPDMPVKTASH